MSSQDDNNIENFTAIASTFTSSSTSIDTESAKRFYHSLREENRLRDIQDSYKMMEKPQTVLNELKEIEVELRGNLGVEPEYLEAEEGEEEKEEEVFIFDPKELDI